MTLEERYWAKVDKSAGPDGCWVWIGGRASVYGHGVFGGPPRILAHRFSWQLAFGPVPAGLNVLHACDNPPCVNPDHLMIGTQTANMQDAGAKGRLGRKLAEATHCRRGHEFTSANTYITPSTGRRTCKICWRAAITRWRLARRKAA